MKKKSPPSTHQRHGGTPYDEPWKAPDVVPPKAAPPRPQASAGVPSAEAVLARLRQQPGSLDDLIGYFKLKKLPEQNALERRLLQKAKG